MAGVIVRFENGKLPYESWQQIEAVAKVYRITLDCVESNPNGLFLHYAGLDSEESGNQCGNTILTCVDGVESYESSPCL